MISPGRFAVPTGAAVLLADLGISAANVLKRAQLPADLFTLRSASLTTLEYYELWRALAAEADDPDLPLRIGRAVSAEAFDPPIFAALCSPNLNVAAARVSQYKPLIGAVRMLVTIDDVATAVEFRWPPGTVPPAVLATSEMVFWVALARLGTRWDIRPTALTSVDAPAPTPALTEYLGCDIRPGDAYRVTFSARDAARPFLTANDAMWEFFEPELRRRLSKLDHTTSLSDRVRAALLELLPSGRGTVDSVARELALSARTIQRQLSGEGTSFQALLNTTREALARHYLARADLSVAQIAFLLGYDEPSSFYRAFQSWTGQTPLAARGGRTDLSSAR